LKEAPYQGIYRISKNGAVTLLTDSITRPNGIAFFPGGKTLLVANSDPAKQYWYAYDLDKDGLFTNGRIFYDATDASRTARGLPDGLKIDRQGNVFASGPGGLWIFDKTGKLLGKIRANVLVSNCSLSADQKTVYMTADMYVLKMKMR
jgi:gluconolactonase